MMARDTIYNVGLRKPNETTIYSVVDVVVIGLDQQHNSHLTFTTVVITVCQEQRAMNCNWTNDMIIYDVYVYSQHFLMSVNR